MMNTAAAARRTKIATIIGTMIEAAALPDLDEAKPTSHVSPR